MSASLGACFADSIRLVIGRVPACGGRQGAAVQAGIEAEFAQPRGEPLTGALNTG